MPQPHKKKGLADLFDRRGLNDLPYIINHRLHKSQHFNRGPGLKTGPFLLWRRGWDSNPRSDCSNAGFQDPPAARLHVALARKRYNYQGLIKAAFAVISGFLTASATQMQLEFSPHPMAGFLVIESTPRGAIAVALQGLG
jgi:hypothetical protein